MTPRSALLAAVAAVAALGVPTVAAAGPGMTVGAAEDEVRSTSIVEAQTKTLTSPDPSLTTMMNPNGRSLTMGCVIVPVMRTIVPSYLRPR